MMSSAFICLNSGLMLLRTLTAAARNLARRSVLMPLETLLINRPRCIVDHKTLREVFSELQLMNKPTTQKLQIQLILLTVALQT